MAELGELEKHHADFQTRNVQIMAVSNDDSPTSQATQKDFPHLVIVADTEQRMAKALGLVHAGVGPGGTDTNAPTTILVDGSGVVRWFFRPDRFIDRLSPEEVLTGVDRAASH